MRRFLKIKSPQNTEITLLFTDIGKSYPCPKFLMSQICLLTLFAKIKFSQNFLDLQYIPFENSLNPYQLASESQLIRIHTVFHSACKYMLKLLIDGILKVNCIRIEKESSA